MRLNQKPSLLTAVGLSALILSGCERDTYTSWNCVNPTEDKHAMVLKKAQMQFEGKNYRYCGSLGAQSYFDTACPSATQEASITFMPASGRLLVKERAFQCEAL